MDLVKKLLTGDRIALSRLVSLVESNPRKMIQIMGEIFPHTGKAFLLGVTGPPGAGKSSLVDKLIKIYRSKGLQVGVIAIDPSSPFTGGALLGDRIRMQSHSTDPGVFIRSLGSRGSHGG
ncbi:MAG TPA: methylmalonyl Co-A mutase-associated GTPase MeaB, partial [Bdellovibrionota bacterium]|nr:methylmalonyl Co-A mutase-associated GTPase MeaB [Bdellovibrionota bacterium]